MSLQHFFIYINAEKLLPNTKKKTLSFTMVTVFKLWYYKVLPISKATILLRKGNTIRKS